MYRAQKADIARRGGDASSVFNMVGPLMAAAKRQAAPEVEHLENDADGDLHGSVEVTSPRAAPSPKSTPVANKAAKRSRIPSGPAGLSDRTNVD